MPMSEPDCEQGAGSAKQIPYSGEAVVFTNIDIAV